MGHNIVLSGLKALNGQLEFFNVDEFEVLAAAEHFMATGVLFVRNVLTGYRCLKFVG
jgi:hypothetical protein